MSSSTFNPSSGDSCTVLVDWESEDGGVTLSVDGKGWTVKGRPRAAGLPITPLRCGWHHVEIVSVSRGVRYRFDTVLLSHNPQLVYTWREPWLWGAPQGIRCVSLDPATVGLTIRIGNIELQPGGALAVEPGAWVQVVPSSGDPWFFIASAPGRYEAQVKDGKLGGQWQAWADIGGTPPDCTLVGVR